jgi:hypothetical protein
MRQTKNIGRFGIRAVAALLATGSVFQMSSCSIGDDGALSAFANPRALSELGNDLFEASPLGRLLGGIDGSLEIRVGDGE